MVQLGTERENNFFTIKFIQKNYTLQKVYPWIIDVLEAASFMWE